MSIARLPLFLLSCLAFAAPSHAADETVFIGKSDCRFAAVEPSPTRLGVSWSGACKDGYAEGKGVLAWYGEQDRAKRRLEVELVRGEVSGPGKLSYPGGSYLGSLRRGIPHGAGSFEYRNGARYEGGVADGRPEGTGTRKSTDGSIYEGEWKAGKRHGRGKEVFTLGGRYDGEWRGDLYNGQGSIVYGSSGRTWSGEFRDGYPGDLVPARRRQACPRQDEWPGTGPCTSISGMGFNSKIDVGWEAVPPALQQAVRHLYPALDERDEPPYPLAGMGRKLSDELEEYYNQRNNVMPAGLVVAYLTVGADGVPTSSRLYLTPHLDMGRFIETRLMQQRFKPALCAGKPCEMIAPFVLSFTRE